METPAQNVTAVYGNKVRVRACGICIKEDKVLLINHALYGSEFWSPPGGGLEFGESVTECLKREFKEETGLIIEVGGMLFMHEFIRPPLHAIELFFNVLSWQGGLEIGRDPEFSGSEQIIKEVRFLSFKEINALPDQSVHAIFRKVSAPEDLFRLSGVV
ncbi:NUDIX domain-containing protein [Dyadobacter psychrotolerans]|uniref:NUDIX domain-containing protein n=1 Tax=Dyadobacter psychrotolerans TaxID=2541721 RepID=A0A4R5DSJ6_9BACT|nr:NUDIX domain-containing protein [Dyadobacter psychrotolerans]TDE17446.1 NUDIX domain-containing protein [Dyadobacter psychrotolerans]